jgi:hypothetical protein
MTINVIRWSAARSILILAREELDIWLQGTDLICFLRAVIHVQERKETGYANDYSVGKMTWIMQNFCQSLAPELFSPFTPTTNRGLSNRISIH